MRLSVFGESRYGVVILFFKLKNMNKLLLLFVAMLWLFTGCTNPTHVYHPLELPEQGKSEIVKYEGVDLDVKSATVAYEARTDSVTKLFRAQSFCYDPQNDYLVFPRDTTSYFYEKEANNGYFVVVPRDSVTLCKNGQVKNNAYFWRNHPLSGLTLGVIFGGLILALPSAYMGIILSVMGNTDIVAECFLIGAGTGGALGGVVGLGIGSIGRPLVDEIQERSSEYYDDDKDLADFLEKYRCY